MAAYSKKKKLKKMFGFFPCTLCKVVWRDVEAAGLYLKEKGKRKRETKESKHG